jgi:hypothetical protein
MTSPGRARQAIETNAGRVGTQPLGRLHRQDEQFDPRLGIGGGGELHQLGIGRGRIEGAGLAQGDAVIPHCRWLALTAMP